MTYPFKISDQLKEKPYSEIDQDKYTPKERIVYCQNCRYSININGYGMKCGQCKSFLIEMPKPSNVELVK